MPPFAIFFSVVAPVPRAPTAHSTRSQALMLLAPAAPAAAHDGHTTSLPPPAGGKPALAALSAAEAAAVSDIVASIKVPQRGGGGRGRVLTNRPLLRHLKGRNRGLYDGEMGFR